MIIKFSLDLMKSGVWATNTGERDGKMAHATEQIGDEATWRLRFQQVSGEAAYWKCHISYIY